MKSHVFTITLSIALMACNSNPNPKVNNQPDPNPPVATQSPVIDQPLKNVQPSIQVFTFENAGGLVQKTARHSIITVPSDAFISGDGSLVKGKVSIEFQEIFNPAEIILSGIPMNVTKDGVTMPFISDGMFRIEASCEGQEVKLAEGKTILVNTCSEKKNTDFDYWYLNEQSGEWENIGDRTSVLSEEQVLQKSRELNQEQATAVLAKTMAADPTHNSSMPTTKPALSKPVAPIAHHSNDFVFNLGASYKDYPELAPYKNVLWKPVSKLDDKEATQLVAGMEKFGANVSLQCKDKETQVYTINYGSQSIDASPVFIGHDRKKALEAYQAKMDIYQQKVKEEADQLTIAKKAQEQYSKTYNMFAVNQMGIYNCDRFYKNPNQNSYTFVSGDKAIDQHVFAILKNNQGIVALSAGYKQDDYYKLPGKDISGFVYTNPQGVVSYARQDDASLQKKNTVNLKVYEKLIENPEQLQALIKTF
jgi:hypothetical protein